MPSAGMSNRYHKMMIFQIYQLSLTHTYRPQSDNYRYLTYR